MFSTGKNEEKSILHLWLELVILFVVTPLFLASPFSTTLKVIWLLCGLFYLSQLSIRHGWLDWKAFLPDQNIPFSLWLRWLLFALGSTVVVYLYFPELLFKVLLQNPLLYIFILFIYTMLSVVPQEWLYRYFMHVRYSDILPKGNIGMLVNGLLFSLAHLMFGNGLVLILTFVGGCLFYRTYHWSRSLYVVSIEHALYGLWLFTLGIGDMLAFPG